MSETRYRVVNKCRYDIGVTLSNGREIVIKAGSFQLLTADDIAYIESICQSVKYFAKKMLVPYTAAEGKEVSMDEIGMYFEVDENPHLSDDEIVVKLKQSAKKIEEWINSIEDMAELDSILQVAKTMDLPASKLKILAAKMPSSDIIE